MHCNLENKMRVEEVLTRFYSVCKFLIKLRDGISYRWLFFKPLHNVLVFDATLHLHLSATILVFEAPAA